MIGSAGRGCLRAHARSPARFAVNRLQIELAVRMAVIDVCVLRLQVLAWRL
jgi:hypothetical protein